MDPNYPYGSPPPPQDPENPRFFQGPLHQYPYQPNGMQESVPNSVLILVFGILGIVFSCFSVFAIFALAVNIVNLVLTSNAKRLIQQDPGRYSSSSISQVKAGRICSIIGLCLTGLAIILFIAYFAFIIAAVGASASDF